MDLEHGLALLEATLGSSPRSGHAVTTTYEQYLLEVRQAASGSEYRDGEALISALDDTGEGTVAHLVADPPGDVALLYHHDPELARQDPSRPLRLALEQDLLAHHGEGDWTVRVRAPLPSFMRSRLQFLDEQRVEALLSEVRGLASRAAVHGGGDPAAEVFSLALLCEDAHAAERWLAALVESDAGLGTLEGGPRPVIRSVEEGGIEGAVIRIEFPDAEPPTFFSTILARRRSVVLELVIGNQSVSTEQLVDRARRIFAAIEEPEPQRVAP